MSVKHTPGPWEVTERAHSQGALGIYQAGGGWLIALTAADAMDEDNGDPEKINAQLLAAAPDLYRALSLMADAWDMPDTTKQQRAKRGKAWRLMRSALAKAEGKPEPTELPTAAETRNA